MRQLTYSDKKHIEACRNEGWSCKEIAASLGVKLSLVYEWSSKVKKS